MRGKSPVSYGWKLRTNPKKRDGCVGGGSGSPRLRRQRGHSFSTFCEGLDSCRIMDYTAAIPYRYEVCRHCEAGMADDCAAEAPLGPFHPHTRALGALEAPTPRYPPSATAREARGETRKAPHTLDAPTPEVRQKASLLRWRGRAGARRGKSRATKCTQSTLSAVAALGRLR
jgi:hypothetical protein